jgi:Zn-dependent M32 family carboxypeptidase
MELGDLDLLLASGGAPTLMAWMAEHVHRHGSSRSAATIVERATGAPIGVAAQLQRLAAIYGPSS